MSVHCVETLELERAQGFVAALEREVVGVRVTEQESCDWLFKSVVDGEEFTDGLRWCRNFFGIFGRR